MISLLADKERKLERERKLQRSGELRKVVKGGDSSPGEWVTTVKSSAGGPRGGRRCTGGRKEAG